MERPEDLQSSFQEEAGLLLQGVEEASDGDRTGTFSAWKPAHAVGHQEHKAGLSWGGHQTLSARVLVQPEMRIDRKGGHPEIILVDLPASPSLAEPETIHQGQDGGPG